MDYKDKLGEAAKLFQMAKDLLADPNGGAEAAEQVETLIAQGTKLQDDAGRLQALEAKIAAARSATPEPDGDAAGGFKSFGSFLQSVQKFTLFGNRDERLVFWDDKDEKAADSRKDLAESSLSSGGALVPPEFSTNLYSVMGENSIVRPRATVIPMARRQIFIPVVDQTVTTAGVPHWFGGMTFDWTEEGGEKAQSDPKFRQIDLTAHKLVGFTRATDELVDDAAISLQSFLTGPLGFVGGAIWMQDYAFLRGTGAGQPLGVLNSGATISVARQSVATPVQYLDLVNMLENFLPTGKGVWVITQSAISNLMTMTDGASQYLWPTLFQGGASADMPGSIFGKPVIFTEKLPAVGSAGDILLADFSYYLIGDRQAVTVESTKFEQWRKDLTSWRMVTRVDGQPWLSAPLTLADGSTQVSPFVKLGAKAT